MCPRSNFSAERLIATIPLYQLSVFAQRDRFPVQVENGQDKGECPIDDETGLPTVWYESESDVGNRRKRCDSDYDPPCQPCEGAGGYLWGDQRSQACACFS